MVMRGIRSQPPIGLLSLFEHYGHVAVGSRLKGPATPVWLTCMESHYTVVFALRPPPVPATASFDVWYYDMLANQVRSLATKSFWQAEMQRLSC